MKNNFKLKFFVDRGEIGLSITWVERNKSVVLPDGLWPEDDEHLLKIAEVVFPRFKLQRDAARGRRKRREAEFRRALIKAGGMVKKIRVTSRSSGKEYEIKVLGKRITCNCPDFLFRRKKANQHCKHISAWIETRVGKETYEKINPPKVKKKDGKIRLSNMTLDEIEYAYKNLNILEEAVKAAEWSKIIKKSKSPSS